MLDLELNFAHKIRRSFASSIGWYALYFNKLFYLWTLPLCARKKQVEDNIAKTFLYVFELGAMSTFEACTVCPSNCILYCVPVSQLFCSPAAISWCLISRVCMFICYTLDATSTVFTCVDLSFPDIL